MNEFPIKAVYSLSEMAFMCGTTRRVLRKLFAREGVEILGSGKIRFVSLSEIERKMPTLYEGIRVAHALVESFQ